jgi:hypothetical protein
LDYGAGYVALRIKCSPLAQHDVPLSLHEENAGINTHFFVVFQRRGDTKTKNWQRIGKLNIPLAPSDPT